MRDGADADRASVIFGARLRERLPRFLFPSLFLEFRQVGTDLALGYIEVDLGLAASLKII